jgi:hypothetical protein
MMVMSAVMKLIPSESLNAGFAHLGWPIEKAPLLASLELGSVIIYLIPQTSILGAILIAGYLGGATATHVRIGDPEFFMPTLLAVLAWLGLWLREPRLKQLIPFRS